MFSQWISYQDKTEFDDAIFSLSTWKKSDAEDPDHIFFKDLGAKAGAHFVHLVLKNKGVAWTIWIKSQKEMVSECNVKLPGKHNIDSFKVTWNNVKE